ncbi:hypothetical protein PFISCL1PPCAC_27932 [Pristionchus fissidentatus]|uniref:Peptidase M13 C-terminal domain-containing protein n=1 Tax=Pristionchus fissidentatus TaxID=1538716 RepID=A0AAV5WYR2_9BILA|nr:hypothetical protein PFISCL1PPCAC_27932 [Pristionchus fissidentatus]
MPALFIILHELHHSVFRKPDQLSPLVKEHLECTKNHFKQLCVQFGEGECHSGIRTVYEDAPDVEALRTAYDIFSNIYSQQKKNVYFKKYRVTRDQAFFYSVGMNWCTEEEYATHSKTDPHSPLLIRLNGMVSLMPEFTRAFKCREGDRMYSDDQTTCHIFGNNNQLEK